MVISARPSFSGVPVSGTRCTDCGSEPVQLKPGPSWCVGVGSGVGAGGPTGDPGEGFHGGGTIAEPADGCHSAPPDACVTSAARNSVAFPPSASIVHRPFGG